MDSPISLGPAWDPSTNDFTQDDSDDPQPRRRRPRQRFTAREDEIMKWFVSTHGDTGWQRIVTYLPARTPRQCRERWKNYLSPKVSHAPWTPEEDDLLKQKVREYGQCWSKIVAFFPDRTDVIIKNRYTLLRRHESKIFHDVSESEPVLTDIISAPNSIGRNFSDLPSPVQPQGHVLGLLQFDPEELLHELGLEAQLGSF